MSTVEPQISGSKGSRSAEIFEFDGFFRSTIEEYTFNFFDDSRVIGINPTDRVRLGGRLNIGRDSPHLRRLLGVFDEKIGGEHSFVEVINNIRPID